MPLDFFAELCTNVRDTVTLLSFFGLCSSEENDVDKTTIRGNTVEICPW
jgi:hypothetical protein